MHVLCYLPVDDEPAIASRAALFLLVCNDFARNVFNKEFPTYPDWTVGGGADIGNAIGTRNGMRGGRELLFIGNPANQAAKLLTDTSFLRLTKQLFEALPESFQDCCMPLNAGGYRISASQEKIDELCKAQDVKWDRAKSAERVAEDHSHLPLTSIDYSDAEVLIDFEKLSEANNKRIVGASIFADVSGFTKFVEDAEDNTAKAGALKIFHVISERVQQKLLKRIMRAFVCSFRATASTTLFHLPKGDEAEDPRPKIR